MAPPVLTALLAIACLVACLAVLATVTGRRLRAERAEAASRLDALAARVARLEARAVEAAAAARGVEKPVPMAAQRADRPSPAPAPPGPTLIAVPNLAAPGGDASAAADLGRRFGPIWELADAGASAEAIARATGQPIGQVELILGLKRQSASAANGAGGPPLS